MGETDQDKFRRFGMHLAEHILKKHPEIAAAHAVQQQMFDGMLMLMNFNTEDPELKRQRDMIRHQIHRLTQRCVVSDETLMRKVAEAQIVSPDAQMKAYELLREMRDVLEERDLYPELERPAAEPVSEPSKTA